MEEKVYPYLGRAMFKGGIYIVWFLRENYGVITYSEVENNDTYKMGALGEFDEEPFEYLPDNLAIRLGNGFNKKEEESI